MLLRSVDRSEASAAPLHADETAARQGQAPKGRISLRNAATGLVAPFEFDKHHAFSVTPVDSERRFILVADSDADRQSWLDDFIKHGSHPPTAGERSPVPR